MSEFSVRIVRIGAVSDHPNADRLSINQVLGFECISAKDEQGGHMYKPGDLVAYIPEDAIVPEFLLRQGFWDEKHDKGLLSGSKGNRVKIIRLRGINSQGILYPVKSYLTPSDFDPGRFWISYHVGARVVLEGWQDQTPEPEDLNVTATLDIRKYEPPIPANLAGQQKGCGHTQKYDFDSIQKHPTLFEPGENVVATEKIHGTCFQIGFVPNMHIEDSFGETGNIYITSKGLGATGRVLKNTEDNDGNLYVRIFKKLDAAGLGAKLAALSMFNGDAEVRIFGEIFGKGVQDLSYGQTDPVFRVFDIKIGEAFLAPRGMAQMAEYLGLETVPVLYEGPFDLDELKKVRDGKDTISGTHMREGIVIRSEAEGFHPRYGRKVAKLVSPDYLLRKNGTEFQ